MAASLEELGNWLLAAVIVVVGGFAQNRKS